MTIRALWAAHLARRAELDAERAAAYAADDYWLAHEIEDEATRLWCPKWLDGAHWADFRRKHGSELKGVA